MVVLPSSPLLHSFWSLLTRLGDSELLLPLVPLAAMWLWLGAGQTALARRWILSLSAAALFTAASKIAFFGWQLGVARWDFTGFSGHAMFSCACWPMLAWVVVMHRGRAAQWLGVGFGFAMGLAIAYSRLPVQAHSVSEVITGALLGLAVSASCLPLLRTGPALPLWVPAGAVALLALLVVAAPPSRTQDMIEQISLELSGHERVYTRHDLRRQLAPRDLQQRAEVRP
ncbi:phosphatase PAP2 family protein [Burkholderiaceae bacterium UC74_6]